ncbi:MAG TPA: ATP-binding cassette domain-containing protein, partial [Kofleriaceae bacterium]
MTAALALHETLPAIGPRHAALARLAGVAKTYGSGENAVAALTGASLDVHPGEVTLIEGPSGSGKTTLISILGLLLTPTAGEVWLEGQNVAGLTERELPGLRARNFGFVFQGFNLFPALSAVENVAIAIRMKNPRTRNADAEARRLLEQVDLGPRMHHLPADLSGGQKQRVAIARALGGNPPILVGDEPTAALDTRTALSGAALDVHPGEVMLIEGPSGSGKTTLISILGLLLTPTAGEVWLEGQNVAGLTERELPGLRARNFG